MDSLLVSTDQVLYQAKQEKYNRVIKQVFIKDGCRRVHAHVAEMQSGRYWKCSDISWTN